MTEMRAFVVPFLYTLLLNLACIHALAQPIRVVRSQEACQFHLAGKWIGSNGVSYEIEQNQNQFSWIAPELKEDGQGVCRAATVSARWRGTLGKGAAEGRIQGNPGGLGITIAWSNKVTFRRIPIVSLRASPLSVSTGVTVQFHIQVEPPGLPGFEYFVDFGDGQSAPLPEPTIDHSYDQSGSYPAIAFAQTGGRRFPGNRIMIEVRNQGPAKRFVRLEVDRTACLVGQEITLRAILEPNTPGAQYQFVFGAKVTEWSPIPETRIQCDTEGVYAARAIVRFGPMTAAALAPILESAPVEVTVERLRVSLQPLSFLSTVPKPFQFRARAEPLRDDLEYSFEFGDGSQNVWQQEPTISHLYAQPDTYQVRVRVRTGIVTEISRAVAVHALSLILEAAPDQPAVGQQVRFRIRSVPQLQGAEYLFRFGEDIPSGWTSEPIAVRAYANPGRYTVTGEIRLGQSDPIQSDPRILVVQRPPSRAWIPLLILPPLFLAAWLCYRRWHKAQNGQKTKGSPKLRTDSHPDSGRQTTKSEKHPVIKTEIRLKLITDPGQQSIVIAAVTKERRSP